MNELKNQLTTQSPERKAMYSKRFLIKNSPIFPTSLYTLAGQTKNGWKMLSFSICNVNLLYCLNFGSTTINCSIYRWIKVVLCTHWYKLILSYTCHCMPQLKLHITWHLSWLSLHMDVWPLNRGNWHCLSWIIACIRHILNFCLYQYIYLMAERVSGYYK